MYVESNFVLELAFEQEESETCDAIVELAAAKAISLVVPAFSLAEPYQTLRTRGNKRNRLYRELSPELGEIGRSKQYRATREELAALAHVLIEREDQEKQGLRQTVSLLVRSAEIIPLDHMILASAEILQSDLPMSGQDAIVLGSVLKHLDQTRPAESCFMNRNSRDFDVPDIRERLERLGCRLFGKFDEGYRFLQATRPKQS